MHNGPFSDFSYSLFYLRYTHSKNCLFTLFLSATQSHTLQSLYCLGQVVSEISFPLFSRRQHSCVLLFFVACYYYPGNSPVGTKVGLLDPINKQPIDYNYVGGDQNCVQVDDLFVDAVSYFVEQSHMGSFIPGNANCADIGNSNNAKCLHHPDLPENACVILG